MQHYLHIRKRDIDFSHIALFLPFFFLLLSLGMMIESMAGKSASLNGHVYDATPFEFSEDDSAIDYFGKLLVKCKYFDKTVNTQKTVSLFKEWFRVFY